MTNLYLEWCSIPDGRVALRDRYDRTTYLSDDIKMFTVDSFEMLRFPITVSQFDEFTKDGYLVREFWHDLPVESEIPSELPIFSRRDHPKVNVTWYEAIAFCRWLSEVTKQNITLPTEQQWQYAAQGDDGRLYPWGNIWDQSKCNNSVGKDRLQRTTTPVDAYKNGLSPFNVSDMSGNVWEWCISEYDTGNTAISTKRKVVKGGSCFMTEQEDFQVGYRYWLTPDNSVGSCGFRCVKLS